MVRAGPTAQCAMLSLCLGLIPSHAFSAPSSSSSSSCSTLRSLRTVFFPFFSGFRCSRRTDLVLMSKASGVAVSAHENASSEIQNSDSAVLIQYVVLRRDLIDTWPLGSILAQGCHASVAAIWSQKDDLHTAEYCCDQNLDHMHKTMSAFYEQRDGAAEEKESASIYFVESENHAQKILLRSYGSKGRSSIEALDKLRADLSHLPSRAHIS